MTPFAAICLSASSACHSHIFQEFMSLGIPEYWIPLPLPDPHEFSHVSCHQNQNPAEQ